MKSLKSILFITVALQLIISSQSYAFFGLSENESRQSVEPVAVIINSELYPRVKDSIDRYLDDLKNEGYEVLFSQWDYEVHQDVEELKNVLKDYHQNHQLQGAVLIGKLPYLQNKPIAKGVGEGPIDTYLMDLNSSSADFNKGLINLDIWVSRIWAPEDGLLFPGMSDAELTKAYFEKNHLYRTCQTPVPDLKIKFNADAESANRLLQVGDYLNSWVNFYQYLSESGYPQEYLKFVRENPAQYLYLKSHSTPRAHSFTFSDNKVKITSKDIVQANIQQPFLLLNACSACKFSDSQSLGNAYLFDVKSKALAIAGLAIPSSMQDVALLHSNGDSFGNNVVPFINNHNSILIKLVGSVVGGFSFGFFVKNIYGLPLGAILGLGVVKFYRYFNDEGLSKPHLRIGFTLLGDPTLKPYVDMDWCPKYDSKEDS